MFTEPTPTPSFKLQATLSCHALHPLLLMLPSLPPSLRPFRPLMAGCTCTLTPPFTPPPPAPQAAPLHSTISSSSIDKQKCRASALPCNRAHNATIILLHSPFIMRTHREFFSRLKPRIPCSFCMFRRQLVQFPTSIDNGTMPPICQSSERSLRSGALWPWLCLLASLGSGRQRPLRDTTTHASKPENAMLGEGGLERAGEQSEAGVVGGLLLHALWLALVNT